MLTHGIAETFDMEQSGDILLGGDDALGRRHRLEGIIDELDVLLAELMVVAEGEWCEVGQRREVVAQLLGRGDACEQERLRGVEL